MFRLIAVAGVLLTLVQPDLTLPAIASEPTVKLPDAAGGAIDGKVALMYWPVRRSKGVELIDPAGCLVHIVGDRGQGTESRVPCGQWFIPGPPGSYKVWLEQGDTISDAPAVVRYAAEPFRGRGLRSVHVMAPAGFVRLGPGALVDGADTVRLFGAPGNNGGLTAFERRVRLAEARAPRSVRMPAGRVLVGLYDAEGKAVALARPVQLEAGKTVDVAPEPPARAAAVLFSLQRPFRSYAAAALTIDHDGRADPPDVIEETGDRVVAIWYSVSGPTATIRFHGEGLPGEPRTLRVFEGKIATIRDVLRE